MQKKSPKGFWPSGLDEHLTKDTLIRVNRHFFAVSAHTLELYNTFDQSEEGVILATAHIVSGVNLCASLTIDNVAGLDNLAAELFAAKSLTIGIPAVS
jgi:hypothetical protein